MALECGRCLTTFSLTAFLLTSSLCKFLCEVIPIAKEVIIFTTPVAPLGRFVIESSVRLVSLLKKSLNKKFVDYRLVLGNIVSVV
jgi:hypothetical protein